MTDTDWVVVERIAYGHKVGREPTEAERYAAARLLHRHGHSKSQITQHLGMRHSAIQRALAGHAPPARGARPSTTDREG
jgi:transposase